MNVFNIERSFKRMSERGWDTLYWLIDMHDTVFTGYYSEDQKIEVSEDCLEVLRWISDRNDQKIIIWTSSYAKHFDIVKRELANRGVYIDFFNENPECGDTKLAEFTDKPYFNILLDDKAGFEMETDWKLVKHELQRIGEW